jgi:hypothetical protein
MGRNQGHALSAHAVQDRAVDGLTKELLGSLRPVAGRFVELFEDRIPMADGMSSESGTGLTDFDSFQRLDRPQAPSRETLFEFLVVPHLYISLEDQDAEEERYVAQVQIFFDRGASGERSEAHAESVQFLLGAHQVVFWEGGVGQKAVIWP